MSLHAQSDDSMTVFKGIVLAHRQTVALAASLESEMHIIHCLDHTQHSRFLTNQSGVLIGKYAFIGTLNDVCLAV